MKWLCSCLGLLAIGLLSLAVADAIGSIPIGWLLGYFAAVIVTNVDRYIFARWLRNDG